MKKDSSILGHLSPGEFLDKYWQKKPLLIRQALPHFGSPLDADEIAGLACENGIESRLIHKKTSGWSLQTGPFDPDELGRLPGRDWTLLVQDVEKHLPDLADYLDLFSFIPHWRIDDLMISVAANGGGVGPHADAYDVFLLQANGRRRWSIAEKFDPAFRENMDVRVLKRFDAEQDWILEPGDMLYLPPNVAHDGVALEDGCMTWSIGFRAPALKDMFSDFTEWLYQRLPEDVMYADSDLQPAESGAGQIAGAGFIRARKLLRDVMQLPDAELDQWFGRFITEPKPWLRCEPTAHPLDAERLRVHLRQGDCLQRDSRARLAWSTINGSSCLFIDGEAWLFSEQLAPLLELLCTRRRLSQLDLAEYLDAAGIELLLQLHQHGALHFPSELGEEFDDAEQG